MSSGILFEHSYRGDVWRLEVTQHEGHTFANFRRWYHRGDVLAATRDGFTMPLERLSEMGEAIAHWRSSGDIV